MLTSGIALFLWFHLEVTKEKCIIEEKVNSSFASDLCTG